MKFSNTYLLISVLLYLFSACHSKNQCEWLSSQVVGQFLQPCYSDYSALYICIKCSSNNNSFSFKYGEHTKDLLLYDVSTKNVSTFSLSCKDVVDFIGITSDSVEYKKKLAKILTSSIIYDERNVEVQKDSNYEIIFGFIVKRLE